MDANEYAKGADIITVLERQASALVKAIEDLLATKALKDGTGYDFTDNGFEAYMTRTDLAYIDDGTDWHNVLGSAETVYAWLVANGHWGVFQKVRRGRQ